MHINAIACAYADMRYAICSPCILRWPSPPPCYKRQFYLFGGAGALWSLAPYQPIHGLIICTMDITIQYNQPTVQFDPLTSSICVDFACFYVKFAFRHCAKQNLKSKFQFF